MVDRHDAAATLRRHGRHLTPQRLALLEILEGRRDHPDALTLRSELQARFRNTSLATVYNNLTLFARLGILRTLATDPGRARFDADTGPHGHVWCRSCNSVSDLDTSHLHPGLQARLPSGFDVDDLAVDVRGTCASCASCATA